ncbi:hypothetical protein SSP24_52810 [Streptomyces spinoverrucosus]|uniref:Uncharacterized protein n=1 Tax=Streptomyces spinoverrucosus TaxID=284043 RepID=A0A4Y3VRQ2_9ACTN|nr:hypothetical protein [Streptomyces spinoverrucosus]GEC07626.1 hypothetical protein SSP24_52810 [Streptomyces spinoverrucosus]GHB61973.1 hypothetical protein GCM10010397_35050 [Streptomyces spinoverrucosus]
MDYWQMDYCSSCRRHLNGALVCPGCGAYAPDIAPAAVRAEAEPEPVHTPPVPKTEETAPLPEGRAARRRQRVRWKKSQRRALVATAVALVGGGLTLTTMDRGAPTDRAQATAAPELTLDTAGRQPAEDIRPQPDKQRTAPGPTAPRSQSPDSASDSAASRTQQRPTNPAPHSAPPDTPVSAPTTAPQAPQHRSDSQVPPVDTAPSATPTTPPQPTSPPADTGTKPTTPDPATSAPATTPTSPQLCVLVLCLG